MNKVQCFNIKRGINLYYIPAEKFKTVSVSVNFHRRLCGDEAAKNALITQVMSRGCRKYPDDISISKRLQELYGAYFSSDVARKGEDQLLSFVVNSVSDRFLQNGETCVAQAVDMLFEMILNPLVSDGGFKKDYVNQEKVNLINEIRAVINDKRSYSAWRLVQNMCEGEAYAVHELGTEEKVGEQDRKSLYEHYKRILRESPVDIFVTGAVDIAQLCAFVEKKFAGIEPESAEIPKTALYSKDTEVREVTEEFDVTQGKLCVGFKTGIAHDDPRYCALMVYNGILGGGAHSKLFNNVRERLSLAYYASSRLERYKGMMIVFSGIEICNKQKALDEIFVQVEAMKNGDISDYEFEATKLSIVNSIKALGDSISYLEDYYLGQVVGGTMMSLSEFAEKIAEVTREQVTEVAAQIKPQMIYFLTGKGGQNNAV